MSTKKEKKIKVTECKNCPFSFEYDMAEGYGCKIDEDNRDIKRDNRYSPITPYWCSLKLYNVVISN